MLDTNFFGGGGGSSVCVRGGAGGWFWGRTFLRQWKGEKEPKNLELCVASGTKTKMLCLAKAV